MGLKRKCWRFVINHPYLDDHPTLWLPEDCKYGFVYENVDGYHVRGFVLFKKCKTRPYVGKVNLFAQWTASHCNFASVNQMMVNLRDSKVAVSKYYTNLKTKRPLSEDEDDDVVKRKKARDSKTVVVVFYGESGTGKSIAIRNNYNLKKIYFKTYGELWNGYKNQPVVVINNFEGWLPYPFLLDLCDRYPLRVPVASDKFVSFNSEIIYITSPIEPWRWYNDAIALRKRLDVIMKFSADGPKIPQLLNLDNYL